MEEKALSTEQKEWRRKWVVLFSALESVVESGIKLGAAIFTGSAGLLADSIHSAADVAGSFMVWIGVRLATHKYKCFPYGFYKIENLLALFIGFAILYGAYEVFQIFLSGENVLPKNIRLGIAAVLFGMSLDFLWGRFEAKTGRLINSPGIEASGNHTVSDVYSSAVVLIGLLGSLFGYNLDRWAALIVAIIISKMGIVILWDNVIVLLDISVPSEKLKAYSKIIARQPGVLTVKSIRGRDAGSFRFIVVDVGLKAYNVEQANNIVSKIEKRLKGHDPTIDTIFVHYAHELPRIIFVLIPTDVSGKKISNYFGSSTHITKFKYDTETKKFSELVTEVNPYQQEEKQRGIKLADHIIEEGIDTVCCKEDLHEKGPGLMFYRFGIDVRKTDEDDMKALLQDFYSRSESVFAKENDKKE
ncbi:cation diffusion facilitator family transporter [candidate division KSB1 bacterium]